MKHDLHNPRRCRIGFGGECRCKGTVIGTCGRCGLKEASGGANSDGCDPTAAQYAVHHFLEKLSTRVFYVALRHEHAVDACRRIADGVGLVHQRGSNVWERRETTWRGDPFTKTLIAATPSVHLCGWNAQLLVVERSVVDEGLWPEIDERFVTRLMPGSPAPVVLRGR